MERTKLQKLKVFETFAGIGAQTKALKNININHEIVAISEWNIDSIISYGYIHHLNLMKQFVLPEDSVIISELSKFTFSSDGKVPFKDISKLNKIKLYELYKAHTIINNHASIMDIKGSDLPDFDLLTYSFPCQAISMAGNRLGLSKGTETSSSLLWEIERILVGLKEQDRLPSYLLMENVVALFDSTNINNFVLWLEFLASIGYKTSYGTLIATDFDVPQIRDRAFAISFLKANKHSDIINIDTFQLPTGKRTSKRLNDILEDEVDELYYIDRFLSGIPSNINDEGIHKLIDIDYVQDSQITNININSFSPTLTCRDTNRPKIYIKDSGVSGFILENTSNYTSRARCYDENSFSPTLMAADSGIPKIYLNHRIRNLTPLERLRLMGFTDSDYENLLQCPYKISNTTIIKQCGNSIVVNVLEAIFRNMFLPTKQLDNIFEME